MKYLAKTPLWHSKNECEVAIGEEVDLSHLTPEQIDGLIDNGAIERVEDKEQTDGNDNRRSGGKKSKA